LKINSDNNENKEDNDNNNNNNEVFLDLKRLRIIREIGIDFEPVYNRLLLLKERKLLYKRIDPENVLFSTIFDNYYLPQVNENFNLI
jgi:hypothetical protein